MRNPSRVNSKRPLESARESLLNHFNIFENAVDECIFPRKNAASEEVGQVSYVIDFDYA